MSQDELLAFGWEMHELVYPLSYGFYGKPVVSAFSIQLDEARRSGEDAAYFQADAQEGEHKAEAHHE
jgi:hypothetical protein